MSGLQKEILSLKQINKQAKTKVIETTDNKAIEMQKRKYFKWKNVIFLKNYYFF